MIRSAAFALILSSAWLISAGPGVAGPANDGQHWTFAATTVHHHKHHHRVVHHKQGGGLPKPIANVVRSERTLNKPTDGGPSNFHPKTAPVHHRKKHHPPHTM